ncbi:oligosaccharide flippase family protein [Paracoccus shandongensis]|uniref:oligosaccharide flippase family protein n=1 Tax=Paracoccus shandongensis TaxID=2816048 RepID=UPI001A8C03FF|nr:oligosaccharide flippase family protein [Paracoccus shandongensis]
MLTKILRSTSGRAASWTMIGFGANYAIRLLSTLALTRLLAPEVFGLMSLAWVLLGALTMLSDVGTVPSVIRSPRGDDPDFLDTAWSVQAVRGFCLGGLVLLLAWPVSRLYDEPRLFPILCAVSVMPVFQGLNSIAMATCRRHVRLGTLTVMGLTGQIVTTSFNVLFAWWLQSVWALVLGSVVGVLFGLVASYLWLPPYRPRLRFHRDAMAEIVTFGRWVLLATLFTYFGGQGSTAIMGLEVPPETLGLITIATTIAGAFSDLVLRVLNQVVFPSIARIYREGGDIGAAVERVKRIIFLCVLPVFLCISLASQPIIDLLYDPRYAQAGSFLALLALNNAIGTLQVPYQNAMLAAGNSRVHSVVMGVSAVSTVLLMLVGMHVAGIYGMIVGLGVGGSLLPFVASAYFARRYGIMHLKYDLMTLAPVLALYGYTLFKILG